MIGHFQVAMSVIYLLEANLTRAFGADLSEIKLKFDIDVSSDACEPNLYVHIHLYMCNMGVLY